MREKKTGLKGLPAILRTNAIDLMVFAAVNFNKAGDKPETVKQTIKNVMQHFGIEGVTESALEVAYYRTQELFVKNGGI